mmetsp:Transcript_38516/g.118385  ORF Transcript_38516/g.118385 Transcript_38516/m.118385 type:complete len:259 (+) Transcript_38516:372-1148(+)
MPCSPFSAVTTSQPGDSASSAHTVTARTNSSSSTTSTFRSVAGGATPAAAPAPAAAGGSASALGQHETTMRAVTTSPRAVSSSGGQPSRRSIAATCRKPSPCPPHLLVCESAACRCEWSARSSAACSCATPSLTTSIARADPTPASKSQPSASPSGEAPGVAASGRPGAALSGPPPARAAAASEGVSMRARTWMLAPGRLPQPPYAFAIRWRRIQCSRKRCVRTSDCRRAWSTSTLKGVARLMVEMCESASRLSCLAE